MPLSNGPGYGQVAPVPGEAQGGAARYLTIICMDSNGFSKNIVNINVELVKRLRRCERGFVTTSMRLSATSGNV